MGKHIVILRLGFKFLLMITNQSTLTIGILFVQPQSCRKSFDGQWQTDRGFEQRSEFRWINLKLMIWFDNPDCCLVSRSQQIAQGVIISREEAVDWVCGTLLFRRIQTHPLFYGLSSNGHDDVVSFVAEKCNESIDQLCKIGAIVVKEDSTFSPSAASIVSEPFWSCTGLARTAWLIHVVIPV